MILDTKLDFQEHLKEKLSKVSKTIQLLRLTIYESFIRPHLDYGDIIYNKAYNSSFHQNLEEIKYNSALAIEEIKYNSALAIAGAIRRTSKELGLGSLEKDDGIDVVRFLTSNLLHTSSILFLCLADRTLEDASKMFLLLK